jgi:hypothetical protein
MGWGATRHLSPIAFLQRFRPVRLPSITLDVMATSVDPETRPGHQLPRELIDPQVTLGQAFAYFVRQPSPRTLLVMLGACLIARFLIPIWQWGDLWIALGILVFWPVQEWIVHSHSLHLKPFSVGRLRVDPVQSQNHRAHHEAPWRADVLFVYPGAYKYALPLLLLIGWIATRSWSYTLTGTTFYLGVVARYEWTHFLIHTGYRGKSAYFRRQRIHHLAHHFRNDNYWFGVTSGLADKLLRTSPPINSVPITAECARARASSRPPVADSTKSERGAAQKLPPSTTPSESVNTDQKPAGPR